MSDDVARELAAAGWDVRVETRDRLVVIIPQSAGAADLTSARLRRAAIALAAARGFTHVALELVD